MIPPIATTRMYKLTIFTTCKLFTDLTAVHQRNALISWAMLEPRPKIVVFGDEDGVAEAAGQLGLINVSYVERDEYNLPLLNFMFGAVQKADIGGLLMWANADIIMVDGVMEAAERCAEAFPDGFLGICRRRDVDLDEPLDFGEDWRDALRELARGGELYTPCSSDVFIFQNPLPWAMPPFRAGRPKWDNAMLWLAAHHKTPVVDLTDCVLLGHPRHEYPGGVSQKVWRGHPSGQANERLAAGKEWCFAHVRRAGWLWRLTPDGLEKA